MPARRDPLPPTPFGQIGVLEYDELQDALLCHLCGGWHRNLAQHARCSHHLLADEYREVTGLNRQTRLITPSLRQRLREATAPLIARLRSEGKLRRWNEDSERLRECKELAAEELRKGMRPETSRRRSESWTEERRQARGERTRELNLAGELRASGEAIGEGLRRYYAQHPEAVDLERLQRMSATLKARGMPVRTVNCVRCGAAFESSCTRAKYCPECRPAAAREYNTAWKRRRQNAQSTTQDPPAP